MHIKVIFPNYSNCSSLSLVPANTSCFSRRLEDVFSVTNFRLPSRLEDVFKTSSSFICNTSSKDVFKTFLQNVFNTFSRKFQDDFEDVVKTSSRTRRSSYKPVALATFDIFDACNDPIKYSLRQKPYFVKCLVVK